MIYVLGDAATSEYEAAIELKNLMLKAWPDIEQSARHHVWIIAGAKCHGQPKRDIDVLLLANFSESLTYTPFLPFSVHGQLESPSEVHIKSFCAAIEVKDHSPERVRFEGTNVKVYYREGWKDITEQNHQQKFSVKNYIEHHGFASPWITSFIWLRNVPTVDLPTPPHNILGSNLTWDRFLNVLGQLSPPRREGSRWILSSAPPSVVITAAELFTKPLVPTKLDRRRMELASQRSTDNEPLLNTLGHKMAILRGRGGTGKTMRLLQVAKQLYDEQNARILILTYNKALVADIRRLLTFMGVDYDVAERSIQIQTVHSFFYMILQALGVIRLGEISFLDRYDQFKDEALEYFASGTLTTNDVETLLQSRNCDFSWDFILVDEGQDWPINEQELLLHLYPYNRFLIADGIDQLTRTPLPAKWGDRSRAASTLYFPLKTCLRMKAGLVRFVTSFAADLGLVQSNWLANTGIPGGRIIIIEGDYFSNRHFHDSLLTYNQNAGNQPVDTLFCLSPRLVPPSAEHEALLSSAGQKFKEWGYQIWDGAIGDIRDSYPTDTEQIRIVQYDSCRGLEGWVVVNLDFDGFYAHKLVKYQLLPPDRKRPLGNDAEEAHLYASRWSLIPLSRAMDTLVIQISKRPTPISKALRKAAETFPDIVEWCISS